MKNVLAYNLAEFVFRNYFVYVRGLNKTLWSSNTEFVLVSANFMRGKFVRMF